MPAYTYVIRNGTGRKTQRYVVARPSYDDARGNKPSWLVHNPFWEIASIEVATLEHLKEALESFDWTHEMSDDYRVTRAGRERLKELRAIAEAIGPEAVQFFTEYRPPA